MLDLDSWDKIPGWFNRLEGKFLYDTIVSLKHDAKMIELGSYRGKSTVAILQACKDSEKEYHRLIAVDCFAGTGSTVEEPTVVGQALGTAILVSTIENLGLFDYLSAILVMKTKDFFDSLRVDADFILVDACHPEVARDLQFSWNVLNSGGVILCHDYDVNDKNSEVVKSIDAVGLPGAHCGVAGASLYIVRKQ